MNNAEIREWVKLDDAEVVALMGASKISLTQTDALLDKQIEKAIHLMRKIIEKEITAKYDLDERERYWREIAMAQRQKRILFRNLYKEEVRKARTKVVRDIYLESRKDCIHQSTPTARRKRDIYLESRKACIHQSTPIARRKCDICWGEIIDKYKEDK